MPHKQVRFYYEVHKNHYNVLVLKRDMVHSFSKYLLSTYYVLGIALNAWDKSMTRLKILIHMKGMGAGDN
jgi:hypothetical protein